MKAKDTKADGLHPPQRFGIRDAGQGAGGGRVIEVLDGDEPCGRFERNYWSSGEGTFAPFMIGDAWFALYSPDYTATRIMSLPDCRDVGGEDGDAHGFCPVELWVPSYRLLSRTMLVRRMTGVGDGHVPEEHRFHEALFAGSPALAAAEAQVIAEAAAPDRRISGEQTWAAELSPWRWCSFGFVAGCIWGDDGSLKVEWLDLSRAGEGVLRREARFGYAELIGADTLRDAVDLSHWAPDRPHVGLRAIVSHDVSAPFSPPDDQPPT